ncbi:MAG: lysophospholipid acyltransferase family protein [Planctomycetota bacterium]|nr:lysophospholipid acyltransferase family protein [Planctomycetota bacterium]
MDPKVTEKQRRRAQAPELRTAKTPFYRFVQPLLRAWFRTVHGFRVEGLDNLPETGGVMLVANHQSYLDIPLISASTRRHVCFVARETLVRSRFIAFLIRQSGGILVRRGVPDRAALREMIRHLESGDCVTVFAEGTRTRDGSLGEFRRGPFKVARQAGVPVVPCGIRGAYRALPRGSRWPRRGRIALRYAPPLDSADPDVLDRTRTAIAAMIGAGDFDSVPPAD